MNRVNELYQNLIFCTENTEVFYYQDFKIDDTYVYRIFDYRITVYDNFLLPDAREARGIMFLLENGRMKNIVSRPMQKFFNYKENPLVQDIDYSTVYEILYKEDGSLISTYLDLNNNIKLKSKGSIASDQANDANAFFEKLDNVLFKSDIFYLESNGYTVNMEWTAPFNCVVLRYSEPKLTVLNVRHRETGEYMKTNELEKFNGLKELLVKPPSFFLGDFNSFDELQTYIRKMEYIEGFIIKTPNEWVKIKTEWYCNLHNSKFSISSDKQLFFAFVDDRLDDLKMIVDNDPYFTKRINDAEHIFNARYNRILHQVNMLFFKFADLGKGKELYDAILKEDLIAPYILDVVLSKVRGYKWHDLLIEYLRQYYQPFLEELYENENRICKQ